MGRKRKPLWKRRRKRPGLAPGLREATPDPSLAPPKRIHVIRYEGDRFEERTVDRAADIPGPSKEWAVTWVNIDGLGDLDVFRALEGRYGLHFLALEDAATLGQRPKVDDYAGHLYIVMPMLALDEGHVPEQISLFVGDRYVVTLQEGRPGDAFDPVRDRLRRGGGQMRNRGPDYLAYALIDAIVDALFPIVDSIGDRLEQIEERVVAEPSPHDVAHLHEIRREMIGLRRILWPCREMLNVLARSPNALISDETRIHLRDVVDHGIRLMELLEAQRELATGLLDLYHSSLSTRLNEIMKALTLTATIFLPLTFIAGVYGMNFDPGSSPWNMPELRWRYGYPTALAGMALVGLLMALFFRRRRWI